MYKRNQGPCAAWIDKLALRPDDLLPAEYADLQRHLGSCPACAAAFADYQALSTRLRTLPRPAPQATPFYYPELFPEEAVEQQKRRNQMNHARETQDEATEKAGSPEARVFPTLPPRRSYQPRLMAFAPAIMVVLLIVASTLLFVRLRAGSAVGGLTTPKLRSGWKQVALYSGIGSKTINVSNVQLPIVWGDADNCQGDGSLQIEVTSIFSNGRQGNLVAGSDRCPLAEDQAPSIMTLEALPQAVQKIVVTADASTIWTFQLLAEIAQPVFPLNSTWLTQMGMGGQSSSEGNVLPAESKNGQTLTPKQWAVAIVCFGTGQGSITLTPGEGKQAFPVCNGQIGLHILTYPEPTQVQSVQVQISGDVFWSLSLLFCGNTDGSLCQ